MKIKNTNPALNITDKNIDPILEVYFQINHLKQIYRQGWLKRGISETHCESVADHCFGQTILSLFICDKYFPNLDRLKVVTMCLIHELGEIENGDITPHDNISNEEKHKNEEESIIKLLSKLPNKDYYLKIWQEFEEGITPEAKLVRELDKLEMGLQAKIYTIQHEKDLTEFAEDVKRNLKSEELKNLFNKI